MSPDAGMRCEFNSHSGHVEIIIRTMQNSIKDTSRQRVIPACCDHPKLKPVTTHLTNGKTQIDISCLNCDKFVIGIY